MKEYTWTRIKAMTVTPEFAPKPFNGKYPTRVLLRVKKSGKEIQMYKGLPTRGFGLWARQWLEQMHQGIFWLAEYDREHIVRQVIRDTSYPRMGDVTSSPFLERYYHPFNVEVLAEYWRSFESPMYVKRIQHGEQVHRVYSMHELLTRREHITPFKIWLDTRVAN